MIEKILENSGYKRYDDVFRSAYCLYQKRIEDAKGIKYFINYYLYRDEKDNITFEVDLQFELDDCVMNITLFNFKIEELIYPVVEAIEAKVEDIWQKLGVKYYEEYE